MHVYIYIKKIGGLRFFFFFYIAVNKVILNYFRIYYTLPFCSRRNSTLNVNILTCNVLYVVYLTKKRFLKLSERLLWEGGGRGERVSHALSVYMEIRKIINKAIFFFFFVRKR